MVPKPDVETDAQQKCVLVVDDDAVIRMVVSESLRDAGLCVVEASRGSEAKTYLRSGARVDLIFSDIQMAGPFDGLELARYIQAIYPTTPVILTSGSAKPAGLHDTEFFIRKPYKLDGVVAMVLKTVSSTDDGIK
jgi:CheY-like chemotaxis protein